MILMPNTYPNLYSVIDLEKNLLQDSAGKILESSSKDLPQIYQPFTNDLPKIYQK